MSNPKISVIVPVYNVEKYLSECLDSIVNQTLKEIEIICVNDGSTDNSLSILEEYASKDNRIKIIDKENEGQGYARKLGLDNASGKYILFCDSDDFYSELTAFEELYNYIEKVKVDVVIFSFINKDEVRNFIYYETDFNLYPQKERFSYLEMDNIFIGYVVPWQKVYSKDFLTKYYDWYFPKHIIYEDMPFHYQVILKANISYLNKYLYKHRIRINSTTSSFIKEKNIVDFCVIYNEIYNITKNKCKNIDFLHNLFFVFYDLFSNYQIKRIKTIRCILDIIDKFDIYDLFDLKNKQEFFFFRAGLRMTPENYMDYLNKKALKNKITYKDKFIKTLDEAVKYRDKVIKDLDEAVKYRDKVIKDLDEAIKNKDITINKFNELVEQNNIQDQAIKQLQNSWSYRIGRLFTYPLSISLEFYKYICDYNLIKKSDLFDSEYYLANNEDVKNAKVDPINHYLKFGWKEGRNPSAKFDGNEYLYKRPDVRVAAICPLVHYLKFGKDKK